MRPLVTGASGAAILGVIEYRHACEAIWPQLAMVKDLHDALYKFATLDDVTLLGVTSLGFLILDGLWMIFIRTLEALYKFFKNLSLNDGSIEAHPS